MEFNRNQYFFAGMLIMLIGLQMRMIGSVELTSDASRFLAQRSTAASGDGQFSFASAQQNVGTALGARKVVRPPEWLGWCLISVGAVLVLHSLAMPKPG